jgi:hypothetical protein
MKKTLIHLSIFTVIISMLLATLVQPVNAASGNSSIHADASSRPVLVVNTYSVSEGRVAAGKSLYLP